MRRVALTLSVVLAVGVGAWWSSRSTPAWVVPVVADDRPRATGTGTGGGAEVGGRPTLVGQLLPTFPGTVWREATVLTDRRFVYWSAPSRPGGRYLVQYVCGGSGELSLRLQAATARHLARTVSCPAPFGTLRVVAAGVRIGVVLRRLDRRPVEVAVQVVALP
ncbi:hypothetical protein [Plantactinospora sp. B5E13]|uniref:hypothetical protein n=1 Tax=Plantactinospora sp. B5E13 TaxID=3153758 RepID=UPI00325CA5C0